MTKNRTESPLHTSTLADEAQALTAALRERLEAAVTHTATAQGLLTDAADLAKRAFDTEAWKTLEYPDWETYCQSELFKMGYIKWTPEQRLELIMNLRNAGLSFRTIAAVAGCNPSTVYRNWSGVADATADPDDELAPKRTRGQDRKSHPAQRRPRGRIVKPKSANVLQFGTAAMGDGPFKAALHAAIREAKKGVESPYTKTAFGALARFADDPRSRNATTDVDRRKLEEALKGVEGYCDVLRSMLASAE